MLNLVGEHEKIAIQQFRRQPGEVIAQVELGKRFTLTRYGKPVAMLQPIKSRTRRGTKSA